MPYLVGTTLGACRIVRHIGSGGVGDVYLADQEMLARRVVVKVLRDTRPGESNARGATDVGHQFAQEARAIAALDHPHILPLYDYGEQDGIQYLIMPYIPAGSLADLIAPGERHSLDLPLAPQVGAEIIRQAASALQFAHNRGFIHRDVKPGNLLIRWLTGAPDPQPATPPPSATGTPGPLQVLLADFGLARSLTELTGSTATTGTPLYTAPEQYRGKPVPATDQYALACLAYLLFCGRTPFEGTVAELHHQHLSVEPTPIAQINPLLPPGIGPVLARALRKEPSERFASTSEFAAALSSAADPIGFSSRPFWADLPVPAPTMPVVAPSPSNAPTPGLTPNPFIPQTPIATQPLRQPAIPPVPWHVGDSPMLSATTLATEPSTHIPSLRANSHESKSARMESEPTERGATRPTIAPYARHAATAQPGSYPDAPGAPIPRRLPWSRRTPRVPRLRLWLALVLVSILALVLASAALLRFAINSGEPTQANTQNVTIMRAGSVDLRQVVVAPKDTPAAQTTLPARMRPPDTPPAGVASPGAHASALPVLTPTAAWSRALPTSPANTVVRERVALPGLSQAQMGVPSPVDVALAANGSEVIEAVNGSLAIITLPAGAPPVTLQATDLFAPVLRQGDTVGQPRLLFDQSSQRWFIVENELHIAGSTVTAGYFDIAVSATARPLGLWYVAQFPTQATVAAPPAQPCEWADYPQIGRGAGAFFLTGNRFACGSTGAFLGAALFVLPDQRFLHGAIAVGAMVPIVTGFNNAARQPVFTLTPAQETASDTVEWLVSNDASYADQRHVSQQIIVWAVTNAPEIGAGAAPVVVGRVVALPAPYADPPPIQAQPASASPEQPDARVADVRLMRDHLYLALATAVNWASDHHTRAGIYWLDLKPVLQRDQHGAVPSSLAVSVLQSGIFGFAGAHVYKPVLLADPAGNLLLAASVAAPDSGEGFVIAAHRRDDAAGAMGAVNEWYVHPATAGATGATGGYLGGCVQPSAGGAAVDPATFWIAGTYATSPPSRWQTLLAAVSVRGS